MKTTSHLTVKQHPDNPAYGNDVLCYAVSVPYETAILFHRKKDAEKCVKFLKKDGQDARMYEQYIYISYKDFRDGV